MQRAFKPISTFPSSSEEGRGRGTSAAKKAKSDTASVDQFNKFLYKFTTNSVSGQIERAKELLKGNNYGWKLLKTQIPILESLTAGLQESEISKLLLPNYKCLKWLYSVNSRDLKSGQWALQVVNSYQLLLISYLTFAERATKVIEVLCQHCIYKFIKDDIMGFRSANARTLKLLREHTGQKSITAADISLSSLCDGHLKIVQMTLNMTALNQEPIVLAETYQFLLNVMESLIVCLIKLKYGNAMPGEKRKAFASLYEVRSKQLSYRTITAFLEAVHSLKRKEANTRLILSVEFLMDILAGIKCFSTLSCYTRTKAEFAQALRSRRTYLLSAFFILDNSALSARFLRTRWPGMNGP